MLLRPGKTTRYPLMLSLLDPNDNFKMVVAQPRRLACQAAARRVAYEQGFTIGDHKSKSPIGYSIRFESFPSTGTRTVDFQTPGVILRRATDDPLLSQLTHLCIDEVHERNADMDLLLALAKQAQKERENHPTLAPLKIILMSATLDSSQWEEYFGNVPGTAVVDVPDVRRFPIDILHMGDPGFPQLRAYETYRNGDNYDRLLCDAAAELAIHIYSKEKLENGSILCFLPGMEEINNVAQLVRSRMRGYGLEILVLHSSVNSQEQARIFDKGSKLILSTNIAETSLTIPDVKFVIDSGRERQFSLLESITENTTVVGSQLATVDVSQAAAKQRAGRAGRVSAGKCYRLYTKRHYDELAPYSKPEMLRMDLSQLVLHSISLYHPSSGHPLNLLLGAPDPPKKERLRQTLYALGGQGFLDMKSFDEETSKPAIVKDFGEFSLTPMGKIVSGLPVSPRIGRMLFLGLALRAVEPAITIASLLSVPKAFQGTFNKTSEEEELDERHSSDIMKHVEMFDRYAAMDERERRKHPSRFVFDQVLRVQQQLKKCLKESVLTHHAKNRPAGTKDDFSFVQWNGNANRVAAQAALVCCASPHIAHLVNHRADFATRDVAAYAKMHPSSVNFSNRRRTHWYVYSELRVTRQAYMHVTSAASPLELALFSDGGTFDGDHDDSLYQERERLAKQYRWLFIADQWVPVDLASQGQRESFLRLKHVLTYDMLQLIATDPIAFLANPTYQHIVLYTLAAVEHHRIQL
jgi:HrpA-like RNA helicase